MKRIYLSLLALTLFALYPSSDVQAQEASRTSIRVAYDAAFLAGTVVHLPHLVVEMPIFGNQGIGVRAGGALMAGTSSYTVEVSGTYHHRKEGSQLDPYANASIGWGFGAAGGYVAGTEAGINYWLSDRMAVNVHGGYLKGINRSAPRAGIGLTLGL